MAKLRGKHHTREEILNFMREARIQKAKDIFSNIEKKIDERISPLKQIKGVRKSERLLVEEKIKTLEQIMFMIEELKKRHLSTFSEKEKAT